jgi:DNA-binding transcriptional LysR family regulator
LRQLRTFIAVAEKLSFTRAAAALHVQQQTVSKTVMQLERELGVELLERTTHEVRLTPAGAALLESGSEALSSAEAAFQRAQQVGLGTIGRVRVGVTPAIGPRDREEVAHALRTGGDMVSVSLHDARPGDLKRMLMARELDLGLIRATGADDPDLHRARLRPTPMVLCLPEGHPLADRSSVGLAEIDGERLLVPSASGTPYTDLLLNCLTEAGASVQVVEGRVTGGSVILTELAEARAVALMSVGTALPPGVRTVSLEGAFLPLLVVWRAGLPPAAVPRLRAELGE